MTPFDRSDMHGLAVAIHGCVGLIEAAVDLIVLYRVDEVLPRVAKQVEVIARMAEVTADAMTRLRTHEGPHGLLDRGHPPREPRQQGSTAACSPSFSAPPEPTPSR